MIASHSHLKDAGFEYRGHTYRPSIDDGDPAVVKLTHDIHDPAGVRVGSIHAVYRWPSREEIETEIDTIIGRPMHPMQDFFNELAGAKS